MTTLFDLVAQAPTTPPVTTAPLEASGTLTRAQVEAWAQQHGQRVTVERHPLGELLVVQGKLGLILGPRGESSLALRQAQLTLRDTRGLQLYYIYPWETHAAKLLWHFESKLGLAKRKYAAKRLRLEEVTTKEGDAFMEKYHIQGATRGPGKVSLALKTKDTGEILAVQQFSRYRFGIGKGKGSVLSSPVWEGLRLCFAPGVQIHGGASRLQKHFEKHYDPERIISYINRSHSLGDYKAHQGFRDITASDQTAYMWVLEGEPREVPLIDRDGNPRVNDLELSRQKRYINPTTMAGAFGKGVGETLYGGRLGSRKQLREHPENGELVHNDIILEAIGYRRWPTAGQAKWEKILREPHPEA